MATGPNRSIRDDRKPVQQAWREAMAKGIGCEMEIRFLCAADNTWRWFMARAAPIEEDGYISGWLIIAFDIDLVVAARNDLRRKPETAAERGGARQGGAGPHLAAWPTT